MNLNIVVAGKTFEVEVEKAEPSAEHGISNPRPAAMYSSAAPKPGASAKGDETKLCRRPLAGVVVPFAHETRRSCSGEPLASRSRCDEDGDK